MCGGDAAFLSNYFDHCLTLAAVAGYGCLLVFNYVCLWKSTLVQLGALQKALHIDVLIIMFMILCYTEWPKSL